MKTVLSMITLLIVTASANAAVIGRYERKSADGTIDKLNIEQGWVSLELSRQVGGGGGPGGLSNDDVIPYPTNCRVKQFGNITSEDTKFITMRVKYVALTDQSGLLNTEHCQQYVNEFNGRAAASNLSFNIAKSDFSIHN